MNSSDQLKPTKLNIPMPPVNPPRASDDELTAADYGEVLSDHRRLVRELDVLINGANAAKQASLCDIVAQMHDIKAKTVTVPLTPPRELLISMALRMRHDFGVDQETIELANGCTSTYGLTPVAREALLVDMAKLYEEVVGQGFYRWDHSRDAFYQRMGQPGYSTEIKDFNHD